MKAGEIVFSIFLIAFVGFIIFGGITCAVINEVRLKRYERSYKTTELGQDLLAVLRITDYTEEDIRLCNKELETIAEQIDEINNYYPNEDYYVKKVEGLKYKYLETKKQLKQSEEYLEAHNKKLEELKRQLPKKYKGIFDYDWRCVEGERNDKDN